MASVSPRDPYNISVSERRSRALELRKQGLNFRDIAQVIRNEFEGAPRSYNERHAWDDVNYKLKEAAKMSGETARQVLQLELYRLDQLLTVCMNEALGGNLKAVDRVLNIMTRRSRYLGLDKPMTYTVNTWQNELTELIRQGKISIGQVRQELGNELTQRLLESGGFSIPEGGSDEDNGQVLNGEFVAASILSGREQPSGAVPQSPKFDLGESEPFTGDVGGESEW